MLILPQKCHGATEICPARRGQIFTLIAANNMDSNTTVEVLLSTCRRMPWIIVSSEIADSLNRPRFHRPSTLSPAVALCHTFPDTGRD